MGQKDKDLTYLNIFLKDKKLFTSVKDKMMSKLDFGKVTVNHQGLNVTCLVVLNPTPTDNRDNRLRRGVEKADRIELNKLLDIYNQENDTLIKAPSEWKFDPGYLYRLKSPIVNPTDDYLVLSHLCHNPFCFAHTVFEPQKVNKARDNCLCRVKINDDLYNLCWSDPKCVLPHKKDFTVTKIE